MNTMRMVGKLDYKNKYIVGKTTDSEIIVSLHIPFEFQFD